MNLDTLTSMAGQSIDYAQLADLNKALRANGNSLQKAVTVGTPTQGSAFTGDFAPLVPQSIQNTLDSATYTEAAVKFWGSLAKTSVQSTLHESVVVRNYGSMDLDPFIGEGEAGTESVGDYARQVVQIKFLAEKREISDVATMVGVVGYQGVSRQGLAQQTIDGTRALMGKLERSLFTADSDLSSLAFDGLYKQVTGHTYVSATGGGTKTQQSSPNTANTNNYRDLRGAAVTINDLIEELYKVAAAPNFGMVNKILVEPRVYSTLVNMATSFALFDPTKAARGQLMFGTEGLKIAGPAGMTDIISCPLMQPPLTPPTADLGSAGAPSVPSVTGSSPAKSGTELGFTAAEAGSYTYKVVAVNKSGVTRQSGVTTVAAVAAGDVVKLVVADPDIEADYYRVYRAPQGETAESALQYLWSFPSAGDGSTTTIVDDNRHLPGTAPIYFLQQTPDVMYWAQLLDFLRRPLAQVQTSIPFLLMLFGALHVKVPTKCSVIDNCSLTS